MFKILIFILLTSITISNNIFKSTIYDSVGNEISNVSISCGEKKTLSDKNGYFKIECEDEYNSIFLSHAKYNSISTFHKNLSSIILYEKYFKINEYKVYGGLNPSNKFSNINIIKDTMFKINGKNHIEDLIFSIPNLNFSGGTSRAQYFQIRGLGELSQFSGEGAPHFYVGYIVDDIDFSGIGTIGFLDDIKQIEIFKGPQSMAYGPNSMAGIINLISNNPYEYFDLNSEISFYSKNGFRTSSTVSIPISKNLFSNFTYMHNHNDGMIRNRFKNINDSNSKNEDLFRFKLLYNKDESVKMNLTFYLLDLNNKYDVWTPDNNGFITLTDFQGYDNKETNALSINSKFQIDNGSILNIFSYSENNIYYAYDGDWGNDDFWQNNPYNWDSDYWGYEWNFPDYTFRNRVKTTNELRINKIINNNIKGTIGFYLSKTIEDDNRTGYLFAGAADNIKSKFIINNYAIYISYLNQINNNINILYTIRADVNRTKHSLQYEKYNWYTYTNEINNYNGAINDHNLFGGSIQSNFIISSNLNLSLALSRGYKTSGINQTQSSYFLNYENQLRYYDTEYSDNIEIGITYNSEKTLFKTTIFYLYRINPQLRLFYQFDLNNPNSFDYATINTNFGYNYGIESNFKTKINKNVILYGSLGTLNTYVSKFIFQSNIYGDRENAHSPKLNLNMGINLILSDLLEGLSFSFNSSYKSSFYFDDQNTHKSEPYTISNCTINYIYKHIELSIWGKNIFDRKYPIRGYTFALDPTYEVKDWKSYGDLASFGITVKYNF